MLQHPAMDIPYKQHAGTVFTSLNNFLKIIPEAERRINTVISFLKTGLPQEQDEADNQLEREQLQRSSVTSASG
jgi:hypothetical protein